MWTAAFYTGGWTTQHRRVVQISMVDALIRRYEVSLDFTVPDALPEAGDTLWVPLTWVPKQILGDVDARDEAGMSVPLANRRVGRLLLRDLLWDWWLARHIARPSRHASAAVQNRTFRRIEQQLEKDGFKTWLRVLIDFDTDIATSAATGPDADRAAATVRPDHQDTFRTTLRTIATHGLVFTPMVDAEPGERRIVKVAFNDDSASQEANRSRALRWFIAATGSIRQVWDSASGVLVRRHFPEAAAVESFHVEFIAPPGMVVEDWVLRDVGSDPSRGVLDERVGQRQLTQAHMYAHWPRRLDAELLLAPEPRGWVRTAWAVSAISAIAVTYCLWRLPTLQRVNNATFAAGGFLAAGAIAAVFVARPREHSYTAERLAGARMWLWLSVATTMLAVAILLVTPGLSPADAAECLANPKCDLLNRESFAEDGRWAVIGLSWFAVLGLASAQIGPRIRAHFRRWRRRRQLKT